MALVAPLEPMAVISSPSAQPASSFGGWAPTPCRRGFACPYLRRRCCFFGHSPWQRSRRWGGTILCLAATMPRLRMSWWCGSGGWNTSWSRSGVCSCHRPGNLLVKRSSSHHRSACNIVRQRRLWVSSMPQITEGGLPGVPQERVQNRTPEQIVDVPLPQIC